MSQTASATANTNPSDDAQDKLVQEKYVARLRARLARPKITVEDARDGMLDCFVSTYHTGVKQGLEGILGVNANPDQVAQVVGRMFRDRLAKHGESFEAPTVDGLNALKEEVDAEFHFSELPAEVSATHDQVCSLLLAKADGLLDHHGDRSVLRNKSPIAKPPAPPPLRPAPAPSAPAPAPATASAPKPRMDRDPVTANLRRALGSYLDEIRSGIEDVDASELLARLERAQGLARSIADFSR